MCFFTGDKTTLRDIFLSLFISSLVVRLSLSLSHSLSLSLQSLSHLPLFFFGAFFPI